MKSFKKYIKIREGLADEAGDPVESQNVQELFKTVWNRYRDSLMDFLEGLANENEDEDLKALINRLQGGGRDLPTVSSAEDDARDEVMPASADRGSGETDQGEN
jgi:hypothetical protein